MHFKKLYNDKIRRFLFKEIELKHLNMKVILKSSRFGLKVKDLVRVQLYYYKSASFYSKIRNSCVFTGRSNGIYRFFRISRIQLRKDASKNNIYGLRKSS
jgi:small subunit ribosomal protein S14